MVAYDSRRTPDPSQLLLPQTATALRDALALQKQAGQLPLPELRDAIRVAAQEARERDLRPENVLAQLNSLLLDAAAESTPQGPATNRGVREWLVMACLRAYWDESR